MSEATKVKGKMWWIRPKKVTPGDSRYGEPLNVYNLFQRAIQLVGQFEKIIHLLTFVVASYGAESLGEYGKTAICLDPVSKVPRWTQVYSLSICNILKTFLFPDAALPDSDWLKPCLTV